MGKPFSVEDIEIIVTATTPGAIAEMLKEGHRRSLERQMGRKWAQVDPSYEEDRSVCADMLEDFLRKPCHRLGLDPKQKGALRAAATNAVMTNSRAKQGGYAVEDVCPLCGAAGDTIHHRVYRCSGSAPALTAILPEWFLEEGLWHLPPPPRQVAPTRNPGQHGH